MPRPSTTKPPKRRKAEPQAEASMSHGAHPALAAKLKPKHAPKIEVAPSCLRMLT